MPLSTYLKNTLFTTRVIQVPKVNNEVKVPVVKSFASGVALHEEEKESSVNQFIAASAPVQTAVDEPTYVVINSNIIDNIPTITKGKLWDTWGVTKKVVPDTDMGKQQMLEALFDTSNDFTNIIDHYDQLPSTVNTVNFFILAAFAATQLLVNNLSSVPNQSVALNIVTGLLAIYTPCIPKINSTITDWRNQAMAWREQTQSIIKEFLPRP